MTKPIEIVSDEQLQVESLLRSNEQLREEYNKLSAQHTKLMKLLQYTGMSCGTRESQAFLSIAVPYDTWRTKGVEAAIFDLLNTTMSNGSAAKNT